MSTYLNQNKNVNIFKSKQECQHIKIKTRMSIYLNQNKNVNILKSKQECQHV